MAWHFLCDILYAILEISHWSCSMVTVLGNVGNIFLYRQLGLPAPPAPPPCPPPSTISPAHGNRGTPNPKWRNSSITSTFLQTREEGLGLEVPIYQSCFTFLLLIKNDFICPIKACYCEEVLEISIKKLFASSGRSQTEEPYPYPVFRPSLFPSLEAAAGFSPAANPPESAAAAATAAATTTTTTTAHCCVQVCKQTAVDTMSCNPNWANYLCLINEMLVLR